MKTWKRGSEGKPERNLDMLRSRQIGHLSYREIGQEFGVSKERARFIVKREKQRLKGRI